jgi:ABC-type dipeptide/oligopeptide/nickel transport system permease subunit
MRMTATLLLAALIFGALLVAWRSPYEYAQQDRAHIAEGSSSAHSSGTDELGRDRTLRVAVALLIGLAGSAAAAALAGSLSLAAGLAAAFAPHGIARAVLYAGDAALLLPWLFLLMIVRAGLPLNLAPPTPPPSLF